MRVEAGREGGRRREERQTDRQTDRQRKELGTALRPVNISETVRVSRRVSEWESE